MLGLKVAGIRRLSDHQSNPWGTLMARTMQARQKPTAQGKVQVTATVTVTYLLER